MDRLGKALASGATAVVLDLEDAVDQAEKAAARDAILEGLSEVPPTPVLVRINARDTAWHAKDLAACKSLPLAAIMLPKAESAADCSAVAEATGKPVIALIETALGLHNAVQIASASQQLAFGSIDYAADLGLAHMPHCLAHARSVIVHAARVANQTAPVDGVSTSVKDAEQVESEARYAREMGFGGKLLIHPAQIIPALAGFRPTAVELDWARRVLEASEGTGAAAQVDGEMIDAPVVKRAKSILGRTATKL